jgi:hypothetical protein
MLCPPPAEAIPGRQSKFGAVTGVAVATAGVTVSGASCAEVEKAVLIKANDQTTSNIGPIFITLTSRAAGVTRVRAGDLRGYRQMSSFHNRCRHLHNKNDC